MKVSIGLIVSHGFPVPAAFLDGWTRILRGALTGEVNGQMPPHARIDELRVMTSHAFPIDAARNELCRLFLDEDDGDYLLFLDTDMKHPEDTPHRLVAHGLDVVTGRYVMRRPPFFTVAMRKTGPGPRDYQAIEKVEPQVTGLLPIDVAGAGVLLIRRRVLQAIRQQHGNEWFRYQVGEKGLRDVSEDMWFYEQAKACGFQAYLDADLVCKHIGSFELDPSFHQPYAEAFDRATAAPTPTAAQVSKAKYHGEAQAVSEGERVESSVLVTSKEGR